MDRFKKENRILTCSSEIVGLTCFDFRLSFQLFVTPFKYFIPVALAVAQTVQLIKKHKVIEMMKVLNQRTIDSMVVFVCE